MSEPETPCRPISRRRPRYSIRGMVSIIVALALIFAVLSPLYHLGRPPRGKRNSIECTAQDIGTASKRYIAGKSLSD